MTSTTADAGRTERYTVIERGRPDVCWGNHTHSEAISRAQVMGRNWNYSKTFEAAPLERTEEAPDLVDALKSALCELSACANQLTDLGRNVPFNGSVNRAIIKARAALAAAKGDGR